MHRPIIRQLALLASLTALCGCLIEIEAPPPRPAPLAAPQAAPEVLVEEDDDLDALLRDADARIAAAPTEVRVGDSATDHDHDHSQCDHDHGDDDHDHEDGR